MTAEHENADSLSRLPLPTEDTPSSSEVSLFHILQVSPLPVKTEQLKKATAEDPILSKVHVIRYTLSGWPSQPTPDLVPYHRRRHELSMEVGCLLWGMRVVVPEKYQSAVLDELHLSHLGIIRMKSLARIHVWWPSIDKQIEELVRSCAPCQSIRNKPPTVLLHPWAWPILPWQRIHVDFTGPFQGSFFMIIVDAHSKWLEVVPMTSTTSEKTIEELWKIFAQFGLPEQLVTDNGPQFTSREFETFVKANGVKHICSAPYHPATNGEAERFVQTFKRALKASKQETGSLQTRLSRFLVCYCSTPNVTTGVTPAELSLKRCIRTRLDLLKPSVAEHVARQQDSQKRHHDTRSKARSFEIGQSVLVENLRGEPKWLPGTVIEKAGPVSYEYKSGTWSGDDTLTSCCQLMSEKCPLLSQPSYPIFRYPFPLPLLLWSKGTQSR